MVKFSLLITLICAGAAGRRRVLSHIIVSVCVWVYVCVGGGGCEHVLPVITYMQRKLGGYWK